MSTQTRFGELRDEVRDHLSKAYGCLIKCLDEDTYGHDQYSKEYIDELHKALAELREIRKRVG